MISFRKSSLSLSLTPAGLLFHSLRKIVVVAQRRSLKNIGMVESWLCRVVVPLSKHHTKKWHHRQRHSQKRKRIEMMENVSEYHWQILYINTLLSRGLLARVILANLRITLSHYEGIKFKRKMRWLVFHPQLSGSSNKTVTSPLEIFRRSARTHHKYTRYSINLVVASKSPITKKILQKVSRGENFRRNHSHQLRDKLSLRMSSGLNSNPSRINGTNSKPILEGRGRRNNRAIHQFVG